MPAFVPIIAGIGTAISTGLVVNEGAEYLTGESITDRMDLPSWSDVEEVPMKVAIFVADFLSEAGKTIGAWLVEFGQNLGIINSIKRAISGFFNMLSNPAVGSYLVAALSVLFSFIAVWRRI